MPRPERFSEVAPLPSLGGWRRALALDRGGDAARPVALSFVPASVIEDPARLAALVRDVEVAGRLHHPAAVAVLGLETVGEVPAVVEAHVPGVTLRALLDAAGRLPPDVAARIALDACGAVGRAHALDAGDGRCLVHGAILPARLVIAEDGAARLAGFGAGGAAAPEDDVRALGAVLHECLAGEPPGAPPAALDVPGVPPSLAAAVAAATGAGGGAGPPSAAAFAQAIAASGKVASHADVAAYAEAIAPAAADAEGAIPVATEAAEEVSAELVQPGPAPARAPPGRVRVAPEPVPEPLPRPPATRPGVDPAGVFAAPAPAPAPRRSRAPLAVALVCLAGGFAAGFALGRLRVATPEPLPPLAAQQPVEPVGGETPAAAEPPRAPQATSAERRRPVSEVRAVETRPAREKPRRTTGPAAATKARPAPRRSQPPAPGASGLLDVSAPAEADVFLDGRRVGRGGLRLEVPAGAHRIEVRLGAASVTEMFDLAPGETWTYEVTPTPQ